MRYARLLKKLSVKKLEALIAQKRRQEKVGKLEAERDRLQKRLARLERKIARLAGAPAKARRAPKKPGRPAGPRKRKFSAQGIANIKAALKRRWDAYHKAQKATTA